MDQWLINMSNWWREGQPFHLNSALSFLPLMNSCSAIENDCFSAQRDDYLVVYWFTKLAPLLSSKKDYTPKRTDIYADNKNATHAVRKICADLAFHVLHRHASLCLCISCMLYVLNVKWKRHIFPLIGKQRSQRFLGQRKNSLSPLMNWNRDIKTGRAAQERQREKDKGTEHGDILLGKETR